MYGNEMTVQKLNSIILQTDGFLQKIDAHQTNYHTAIACLSFVIVMVLIICFVRMFLLVRKRHRFQQTAHASNNAQSPRQQAKQEQKAVFVLFAMASALILWLIPAFVQLISSEGYKDGSKTKISNHTYLGFNLGRCVISFINPIMYTLYKADFMKAVQDDFRGLLKKCKCYIIREKESEQVTRNESVSLSQLSVATELEEVI